MCVNVIIMAEHANINKPSNKIFMASADKESNQYA